MNRIFLTLAFLVFSLICLAQPSPPDPVPVDGGLSLLAMAGGGLAYRTLRKINRR